MLKRLIALLLFTLILSSASLTCMADSITPVAPGVNLIRLQRQASSGNVNITIVSADISRQDVHFGVAYPKDGAGKLENVMDIAKSSDAVAAINGDFFAKESGTKGSAVGYNATSSNIISNPNATEKMATLAFDSTGKSILDYFSSNITLSLQDGMVLPVKNINKYDSLDGIVIYNRFWGKQSLGSTGTQVEAVVVNDKITEIRRDMPPASIPENGYIIAGLTDYTNIFEMIKVDENVKLEIKLSPEFNAAEAIGGGTILVKDGQPYEFTHNIKGANPRSAIGLDKDGKTLYLIAVDGRGAGGSFGMTQTELGDFLIEYGIYNALNLDGGGSTQLVSRVIAEASPQVQNKPTDSYLRPVANAPAIYSTALGGKFEGILLDLPKETLANKPIELKIKAYDNAYLPFKINLADVSYTITGVTGEIKGNIFTPNQVGKASVIATYKDTQAKSEIEVNQPLSADTKILYNFEKKNGNALPYPEYVKTSYELSSENYKAGISSGKLSFDFTPKSTELQSTALQFENPIEIPQGAKSVGLWVHGTGDNGQWLRLMLKDSNGNLQRMTLANRINWDGWKFVEADLTTISLPATLTRVYLVQPSIDINTVGSVYFDELQVKMDNPLNWSDPLRGSLNGYKIGVGYASKQPMTLMSILENYKLSNSLKAYNTATLVNSNSSHGKNFINFKRLSTKTQGGTQVVFIDNSKELKSDIEQWKWVINNVSNANSPALVLVFNSKLDTTSTEYIQLHDELSKAVVRDITVFCLTPSDSLGINQKDGVRYVALPQSASKSNKIFNAKLYRFELSTSENMVKFDIKVEGVIH